jgi:hypothetical protein
MSTERPIIFNAAMVRALLDGRKTMTRRIVKPQPPDNYQMFSHLDLDGWRYGGCDYKDGIVERCPYGQPGDRLWVREAWAAEIHMDHLPPRDIPELSKIWLLSIDEHEADHDPEAGRWRPGMFMPRWASRILLEITNVRVERVQEISESDSIAEGCHVGVGAGNWRNARHRFEDLWDSINGSKPGCSWSSNPWTWCISFKRIDK